MRWALALLALALLPWPAAAASPVHTTDAGWAACSPGTGVAFQPVVAGAGSSGTLQLVAAGWNFAGASGCLVEIRLDGAATALGAPARSGGDAGLGTPLFNDCRPGEGPDGCMASVTVPFWIDEGILGLRVPYVLVVDGAPAARGEAVLLR